MARFAYHLATFASVVRCTCSLACHFKHSSDTLAMMRHLQYFLVLARTKHKVQGVT